MDPVIKHIEKLLEAPGLTSEARQLLQMAGEAQRTRQIPTLPPPAQSPVHETGFANMS